VAGEDVLVVEIDVGDVVRRRGQIAVLELRRADLYGEPVEISDASASPPG
jgi:hypothetical protein